MVVLALSLFFTTTLHAQAAVPGVAYAESPDASRVLQRALDGIHHQQWMAQVLYVVSAILGGTGTALAVFGTLEVQRGGGPELALAGAGINLAHVVTTIIGASLDFGSASQRHRLYAAHAEVAFELTPGPGDAGLGLALHF
jgi:hypothetical protein